MQCFNLLYGTSKFKDYPTPLGSQSNALIVDEYETDFLLALTPDYMLQITRGEHQEKQCVITQTPQLE